MVHYENLMIWNGKLKIQNVLQNERKKKYAQIFLMMVLISFPETCVGYQLTFFNFQVFLLRKLTSAWILEFQK